MDFEDLQSYARLLNSFNIRNYLPQGKQIHLLFLKKGVLICSLTIANRLLQMYARCGHLPDARKLFDEMTQRNSFTWNTLVEGYLKYGNKNDALSLFRSMPCKDEFSWNVVISGFAKTGDLAMTRSLFSEMPEKNAIAWNTMIHTYVRHGQPRKSLMLFKDLLNWEVHERGSYLSLDKFLLATAVGACGDVASVDFGKQIHARMILDSVEFDAVLGSSLVNMYGKCGDLDSAYSLLNAMEDPDDYSRSALISGYASCGRMSDARRIFELKTDHCAVLWNSIIAGYVSNNEMMEGLLLFNRMHKEGFTGDSSTFCSALSACSSIADPKNCMQLHGYAYKLGITLDLIVASALIDAYAKCGSPSDACNLFGELKTHDTVVLNSMITIYSNCGRILEARYIFDNMPSKSLISWNSMIVALSQNSCPVEAIDLFCKMNQMNLSIDQFSLAAILSACASIASLELGEQAFARAIIVGLDSNQVITTSLIDFYCKCGFINVGRKLFDQMLKCDEVSWNSMLMGYAMNGYGIEVLTLFHEMRREGVLPTDVTFTAVLSACNHRGLVEEGKKMFCLMKHAYCIDPGIEHYSCLIDLFARAGCPQEALDLIDQMPYEVDASMWSSILKGCIANGDKILAENVAERIMKLDPQNSGALIQLSSVLASTGDWEQSAQIRKLMRDKRIRKNPGQSWSEF